MCARCKWNVWLHMLLPLGDGKKIERLLRLNTLLHAGVNKMNKTWAGGEHCLMLILCRVSADTHRTIQVPQNRTRTYGTRTSAHIHKPANTRTCTSEERHSKIHTRTRTHTRTHTVVQSVERACWVAVSNYSAAMATSSMTIDSAAKWVRVCECDNLVKITFKQNILHKRSHQSLHC